MIDREQLRTAFLDTVKANKFTAKQVADACSLSVSRVDKAISGLTSSNAQWASEYMCLCVYWLAKKTKKGTVPETMQQLYELIQANIAQAAKTDYSSRRARWYVYNGEKVNISQLAALTGKSRYGINKLIASADQGDDITGLFETMK